MKKDAVASRWFSSVNTVGTPNRGITTALVGEMVNGLLPVVLLLLVFEWVFVISAIAFMVSVTGTGYSHIFWGTCATGNISPASNTYKSIHARARAHEHKRNVRAHWKKTQQWDSISLPVLNLTFEPNVCWYLWQVWEAKGRIKQQ